MEANLWGAQVNEVMVSDDSSEVVFVGAVIDSPPDKLDEAIRVQAGPRHRPQDAGQYPVREAQPGSQIVYFKDKSKIYCLKYKPLPPRAKLNPDPCTPNFSISSSRRSRSRPIRAICS